MVQKEKELLLKDLCCRLPYGIKIKTSYDKIDEPIELRFINPKNESFAIGSDFTLISGLDFDTYECKPYLFPLSSITYKQFLSIQKYLKDCEYKCAYAVDTCIFNSIKTYSIKVLDYFHKWHIDYRGLISMRLAIDATNLNIY